MVSVGTFLSIGIIGAIAVGGYALYRNADKAGGAVSRGVQTSITNPLGNYFDNLWKNTPTNSNNPSAGTPGVYDPTSKQLQEETRILNERTQRQYQQQYGQTIKGYQDILDVYKKLLNQKPSGVAPPIPKTFPGEEHRGANPNAPKNEPLFTPSPAGWFYQNFTPGGRKDRQIKLKQGSADALRKRGYDLHFLTPSQKLSQSAFNLFGKSKGYL